MILIILGFLLLLIVLVGALIFANVYSIENTPEPPVSINTTTSFPTISTETSIIQSTGGACQGFNGPTLICVYNASDISFSNSSITLPKNTYKSMSIPITLHNNAINLTITNNITPSGWVLSTWSSSNQYIAVPDLPSYTNGQRSGVIIYKYVGKVLPLLYLNPNTPNINNSAAFMNSLYNSSVSSLLSNAIKTNQLTVDFTYGQLDKIINMYIAYYNNPLAASPIPANDKAIISFLKQYITVNTPFMWIPDINFASMSQGSQDPVPVYNLTGYSYNGINAQGRLDLFFKYLLLGAHIVFVTAPPDLACMSNQQNGCITTCTNQVQALPNLIDEFFTSGLTRRQNPYTDNYFTNDSSYYLNVTGQTATHNAFNFNNGILLSMLFGKTSDNSVYNSYIQMDGWPNQLSSVNNDNTRYNFYNDLANKYVWSVSPFGACAYNQKRATPIFISTGGFNPNLYQTLKMNPYYGAYARTPTTPQAWLRTDLVNVNTVCSLPSQFIGFTD